MWNFVICTIQGTFSCKETHTLKSHVLSPLIKFYKELACSLLLHLHKNWIANMQLAIIIDYSLFTLHFHINSHFITYIPTAFVVMVKKKVSTNSMYMYAHTVTDSNINFNDK